MLGRWHGIVWHTWSGEGVVFPPIVRVYPPIARETIVFACMVLPSMDLPRMDFPSMDLPGSYGLFENGFAEHGVNVTKH